MSCESVREKLTAYLDGELEGERGSAVRGHLRGCDACRQIAADEAALRDGLRSLPPLDPPASLWAGVQSRLAAEEVKDAERPAWGRALTWLRPRALHIGFATVALGAAIVLLVMKLQRDDEQQVAVKPPIQVPVPEIASNNPEPPRAGQCNTTPSDDKDVSAAIAAEPAAITACYAQTVSELIEVAKEARGEWPADRQRDFDIELEALQEKVVRATDERPRQQAYRKMIRYLQRAVVRDDVALANLGGQQ
ncbi:MAG TPA: zf-HC2 domain-containing protein [Kofleriaceae bacterium]